MNPMLDADFYKDSHRQQYPAGTELVVSNLTARSGKHANIPNSTGVVFFGLQHFIQDYLINEWNSRFFRMPAEMVVPQYKALIDEAIGGDTDVSHVYALHELGFLPIRILSLDEGEFVPYGVPLLAIHNTYHEFFWLTNYLETVLSCELWKPITSATTARHYRQILENAAKLSGDPEFVKFQGHDFSFRGMSGRQDAAKSGAGHLLSFVGTDTKPAIELLRDYYWGTGLIGCSVPATEHSVMCMGTKEDELGTFRRLINEVHPTGIVSIVSDTWDFFRVLTEFLPELKDEILARDGKVVIRPDSGDPFKIICGDADAPDGTPERKGSIQLLWEVFGGTVNEKGFKELDPHIGLIYGDSITPELAKNVTSELMSQGFASTNVVFGIGSFTYQMVTRDTHGLAMKATYGRVRGEGREIFKEPKTDAGKRSLKGLFKAVRDQDGLLTVVDGVQETEAFSGYTLRFTDGIMLNETTLDSVRERLEASL